jgi:hypothetical protein
LMRHQNGSFWILMILCSFFAECSRTGFCKPRPFIAIGHMICGDEGVKQKDVA